MSLCMSLWLWFRPKPRFQIGDLVLVTMPEMGSSWMIIKGKKFVRPTNTTTEQFTEKQWTYSGNVLRVEGKRISIVAHTFTCLEKNLWPVSNLYPQGEET